MTWQLFTIISVVALSFSVLLQRVLLSKDKIDPYAYVVVFQSLVGVLLLAVAIAVGFKLPNIDNLLVPAAVSAVAFGVGHIAYAKTLQVVEASAFSVLFATQAIWIMLFGIVLFNESLTALQIIGTVLIFGSVGILSKHARSFKLDKGTSLGLLTGLLFGIAITSWAYVGRHTDGLSWAAISFFGPALIAYCIRPKSSSKMPALFKAKIFPKLLVLAALYAVGSLAMLYAYQKGLFSIVTPLRQTSIIVTVLLALLFLSKERNHVRSKLLAAIVCFIGVIAIVL